MPYKDIVPQSSFDSCLDRQRAMVTAMKRKALTISLMMLLCCSTFSAQAAYQDFKYKKGEELIEFEFKRLNTKIYPQHKNSKIENNSPFNTYLKINSLLADGKIGKAAKLTNDPETFKEERTAYKKRIGDKEFKKISNEFFTNLIRVVYELKIKDSYALVISVPKYAKYGSPIVFQSFVEDPDGNFLADEKAASTHYHDLVRVITDIKEEKIKI